jgi:hypothetical protein
MVLGNRRLSSRDVLMTDFEKGLLTESIRRRVFEKLSIFPFAFELCMVMAQTFSSFICLC